MQFDRRASSELAHLRENVLENVPVVAQVVVDVLLTFERVSDKAVEMVEAEARELRQIEDEALELRVAMIHSFETLATRVAAVLGVADADRRERVRELSARGRLAQIGGGDGRSGERRSTGGRVRRDEARDGGSDEVDSGEVVLRRGRSGIAALGVLGVAAGAKVLGVRRGRL